MDELEHHGIKGMRWGARKEQIKTDFKTAVRDQLQLNQDKKQKTHIHREYETAAAVAGVTLLGIAFVGSPRARAIMKVPASATVHYMSDKNHRRKVGKVLYKTGVLYSKL